MDSRAVFRMDMGFRVGIRVPSTVLVEDPRPLSLLRVLTGANMGVSKNQGL